MALVKQHLSSDMQTAKKHVKHQIQNYQMNIRILYQQTKLRTHPGNFGNPQIVQPKF